MTISAIALTLVALGADVARPGEHELVVGGTEIATTRLRTQGVHRIGADRFDVWLRRTFKKPRAMRDDPSISYTEILVHRVIDCRNRRSKTTATVFFDAQGEMVRRLERTSEDRAPGDADIIERSCRFLTGR